jgi:hypothetical protein
MKDHMIPHIVEKKFVKEMYDALVGLYQNENTGRELHLKHQLQIVKMSSEDTSVSYLMKITHIQDQRATISETVEDVELVNVVLRGLLGSWEPFMQVICAREFFDNHIETGFDLCVELGMGMKHAMRGFCTISLWMELGDVLRVSNVLWEPELRRSVLSVSTIEEKGYAVLFRNKSVLLMPKRSSLKLAVVLGVREGNLYRLKGRPMRAMASSSRETNEEQVAPPVVQDQRESSLRIQWGGATS